MAASSSQVAEERVNYAGLCRVYVELCRNVLWEIVTKEISVSVLSQSLSAYLQPIPKHRYKPVHYQIRNLCGLSSINKSDCDISVLYAILRNVPTTLPQPTQGWGKTPRTGDERVLDDVERIREGRNSFYGHPSAATITDIVFKDELKKIKDIIVRLDSHLNSNFENELCQIESDCKIGHKTVSEYQAYIAELNKQKAVEADNRAMIKGLGKDLGSLTTEQQEDRTRIESLEKDFGGLTADQQEDRTRIESLERTMNEESEKGQQLEKRTDHLEAAALQHTAQIINLEEKLTQTTRGGDSSEDEIKLRRHLVKIYHEKHAKVKKSRLLKNVDVLRIYSKLVIREDLERQLVENNPAGSFQQREGKNETCKGKTIDSYEEIFFKNRSEKQHQIYLLGEAGVGKTTFCQHLVNLWCSLQDPGTGDKQVHTEYKQVLTDVDFLFYVQCRNAKTSESVLEMILNQSCPKVYHDLVTAMLMSPRAERCLVVLDGLDEWVRPSSHESNTVYAHTLPNSKDIDTTKCTVLTTSRPWKIEALDQNLTHSCRVLEIQGLDEVGVESLSLNILRELGENNEKNTYEKFSHQIDHQNMTEIIKIPLMLTMVLVTWYKRKQTLNASLCLNYSDLIEYIIGHSELTRDHNLTLGNKTSKHPLPSCFTGRKLCVKYGVLLEKLSKLAFNTLFCDSKEGILVFDKHVLCDEMGEEDLRLCLELGLLSESDAPSETIISTVSVSFLHKSLQEFLASVHFCGNAFDDCFNSYRRNVTTVDDIFDSRYVVVFLCGLSPDKGQTVCRYVADLAGQSAGFLGYRKCSDKSVHQVSLPSDENYVRCERNVKQLQEILLKCNNEAAYLATQSSASQKISVKSRASNDRVQQQYNIPDIVIDNRTDAGTILKLCTQGARIKSLSFDIYAKGSVETPFYVVESLKKMDQIEKLCLCVPVKTAKEYIKCMCRSFAHLRYLKAFSLNVSKNDKYQLTRNKCKLLLQTIHKLPALLSLHLRGLDMTEGDNVRFPKQLQSLSLWRVSVSGQLSPLPYRLSSLSMIGLSVSELKVSNLPLTLTLLYMTLNKFSPLAKHELMQYLKQTSSLQRLGLDGGPSGVCVSDEVDARPHQSLDEIFLLNLDLKSGLLLPQSLQSIHMKNVNMSAERWDCLIQNLSCSLSHSRVVSLVECSTINSDTRSYINDNFTVVVDETDSIGFVTAKLLPVKQ